jgi:hypothetical protein
MNLLYVKGPKKLCKNCRKKNKLFGNAGSVTNGVLELATLLEDNEL